MLILRPSNNDLSWAVVLAVVIPLLLWPRWVSAQDSLIFTTPAQCTTEGGSKVDLTPGRYLPEQTWEEFDVSFRLQEDTITRLKAENESLKKQDEPLIGWKSALFALGTGIVAGYYTFRD